MSKELEKKLDNFLEFTEEKIALLKQTVCKGASDSELQLFLHVCMRTGLDPFMRQIYSIARGGQRTIQTGIDGFRLIAERTHKYMPGKEPTFNYNEKGELISATSYIKKLGPDGMWHEISASAFFSEYNPGNNPIWKKMPHLMLAKCAETLAIRKSFPADLSGIYADEEMDQADTNQKVIEISEKKISEEQIQELKFMLSACDPEVTKKFETFIKSDAIKANRIEEIPISQFSKLKSIVTKRYDEALEKQKAKEPISEISVDTSFDPETLGKEGENE